MKILAIDAAAPLEIIVAGSEHSSAEASSLATASHSATIIDAIDRCLKKAGITMKDIDCIGVGVGPGSFTGVRIAVSTARMLAQVLHKPAVGIKTQLLYAVSVTARVEDNILIAFDAKKGRVFGALYRTCGDALSPREIMPPGDYDIRRLVECADPARMTHLVGSGIEKYPQALSALVKRTIVTDFAPSGKAICDLVRRTYLNEPDAFRDYNRVTPFYARKSDAEAARETPKGR